MWAATCVHNMRLLTPLVVDSDLAPGLVALLDAHACRAAVRMIPIAWSSESISLHSSEFSALNAGSFTTLRRVACCPSTVQRA